MDDPDDELEPRDDDEPDEDEEPDDELDDEELEDELDDEALEELEELEDEELGAAELDDEEIPGATGLGLSAHAVNSVAAATVAPPESSNRNCRRSDAGVLLSMTYVSILQAHARAACAGASAPPMK
jgi:hypothetical protein